jgi:hypothetical protein
MANVGLRVGPYSIFILRDVKGATINMVVLPERSDSVD